MFLRYKKIGSVKDINISFEFFPPKTEIMEKRLWHTVECLAPLQPSFVSVTYGAGGSTRQRTERTIVRILKETDLTVASHLTCVDATREEVDKTVYRFWKLGIHRFVALRGDPVDGIGKTYKAHPGGYSNAVELVAALKTINNNFDISVSAYPEKHPESRDFSTDIDLLKRKIDNGAVRAITQAFFDNDLYERYLEKIRAAGIYIPILPGILPIHNFWKVQNFCSRNGTYIPEWLARRFDGLENNPETHSLVSAAAAAEQVMDLIDRGINDFHFYTLNQASLTYAMCHFIGIRPKKNSNDATHNAE